MTLALTGTPGTGKTSCARVLAKRGYTVVSLNDIIRRKRLGKKDRSGCIVVDPAVIRKLVPHGDIIEGHLSHFMPVKVAVILRCDSTVLEKRLARKRWKRDKIRENAEAEALDVIVIEAVGEGKEIYEVDTTRMSPEEVADAVESIIKGRGDGFKRHVDFSEVVLTWY
jgi:adenylate kinase